MSSFRGERKPSTGNKPARENIMTKIVLGKTPKTFAAFPVDFPMPDGTTGTIQATFKYRTRTQFGEFLNKIFADAGEEQVSDGNIDFEVLFSKTKDKNADHLLEALDAWEGIDAVLNRDSLQSLANELPAASVALMAAYNKACTEGKLGNLK